WKVVTGAPKDDATARQILNAWKNDTPLGKGVSMAPFKFNSEKSLYEICHKKQIQPYLDFYHHT
ncbi:unnamed protein product, partial [marine sediment metagenome]